MFTGVGIYNFHRSAVGESMAARRNAGEKKEGSESVEPAHCITRNNFRAAEFRVLYCKSDARRSSPNIVKKRCRSTLPAGAHPV
ncbi:hypothetical protein EVAR_102581_1 [Eumeta japonica]|uniref:Uncharacterized protein n=1 Tax=Eumeta variegata TaxID=151549 RepID=A0A4C1TVD1_EUMVA|nr:hypothetical protein EVAR_102581_1 [Eumeta japonica]